MRRGKEPFIHLLAVPFWVYTLTVAALYGLLWGYYQPGFLQMGLYFVTGIFLWSFAEYMIHRFILHLPFNHRIIRFLFTGFHTAHHQGTENPHFLVDRVAHTYPVFLLILAVMLSLNFGLAGNFCETLGLMPGILGGYLLYNYVHFAAHRFKPKTAYARWYRANHHRHHFQNQERHFGVTSPFWDILLRTN
jgi:hypothetical protein